MNNNTTTLVAVVLFGAANLAATAYMAYTAKKTVEDIEATYEEEKAQVKKNAIQFFNDL